MSLYDDMRDVVREILSDPDFKQGVISYVVITPGNGPKNNPGPSTSTPYEYVGAVARGVSFKYVQNGMAIASDTQITAPIDPRFTLDVTGMIIKDGDAYKVVKVLNNPDVGTPVSHTIIARKG